MLGNLKYQIRKLILREFGDQTFQIGNIKLTVDFGDDGGRTYRDKRSFEEIANPLYAQIREQFNPNVVIDIGANYGFTGVLFAQAFPQSKLILVEPDTKLCKYIEHNATQNGLKDFTIVNAICAETDNEERPFSINPYTSQDNRVTGESDSWKKEIVQTVSLNHLTDSISPDQFVFIKIDTQGYESMIFSGGNRFLTSSKNWILRTEFSPDLIRSQGFDPNELLSSLVSEFKVTELPKRPKYKGDSLNEIFNNSIADTEIPAFISYIESQDKLNKGWCDLLIAPNGLANS